MDIIEQLKNSDTIVQGWFIAASGLIGVFLVLVLFFATIKLLQKTEKKSD